MYMLICFSHVRLFATPGTVAHQVLLSMRGISRQEYFSMLPCPPPGDFPDSAMKLCLLCFLHCRWILYPLSQLRSPSSVWGNLNGNSLSIGYCCPWMMVSVVCINKSKPISRIGPTKWEEIWCDQAVCK